MIAGTLLASATMSEREKRLYRFGPFSLDAAERRLLRDGDPVPLAPKVFDTLLALIEESGRLVAKNDLMSRLWPDTFVEDATLARNISDLRKALGESGGEASYIETVPKAGYRFVGGVTIVGQDSTLIVQRRTKSRVVVEEEISAGPLIRSIAVLPFKPLAAGDSDDYLGLGVADALITRLSKLRRIRVRPTSAIARYSGASPDPVAVGRELDVESVLEGNIQRAGDRIRVTVQLVNVDDGASLWAEKLDEKFTDIFAVEDSISEQVAHALMLEVTADEHKLLQKRETDNINAYELYLKGRYHWNKRTTEQLGKGAECFRQAIELDPSYASAYAGLSDSYTLLVIREALPPEEGFKKAKAAAEMALQIDESLGEAQASLAHAMLHNWEWAGAQLGFKRAIELNPNYPSAHHWYSEYLMATGKLDLALAEIEWARELDPLSLIINAHRGDVLFFARRYEESAAQYKKVLELDSNFFLAQISLAGAHAQLGNYEQAVVEYDRARSLLPDSLEGSWMLGQLYAIWGKQREARAILDGLVEQSKNRYVSPCGIAMICAALGDKNEAFRWLEKAYEVHDAEVFNLKVEPRLDSLRADARYQDLLSRIGLES